MRIALENGTLLNVADIVVESLMDGSRYYISTYADSAITGAPDLLTTSRLCLLLCLLSCAGSPPSRSSSPSPTSRWRRTRRPPSRTLPLPPLSGRFRYVSRSRLLGPFASPHGSKRPDGRSAEYHFSPLVECLLIPIDVP